MGRIVCLRTSSVRSVNLENFYNNNLGKDRVSASDARGAASES